MHFFLLAAVMMPETGRGVNDTPLPLLLGVKLTPEDLFLGGDNTAGKGSSAADGGMTATPAPTMAQRGASSKSSTSKAGIGKVEDGTCTCP